MKPARVLCVDDDPLLLDGLRRTLGRSYELHTETDAPRALERMRAEPPFSVVISDMRMPAMEGTQFLHRAQEISPDATRMLLTGHADLATALSAVNDGYVFRLLMKPCPSPVLEKAVGDAIAQHQLVTSERVLLAEKVDAISAQLLQAERLATLGTLACGVGHELNNITSVFTSVLDALKEAAAAGLPPDPADLEDLTSVAGHLRAHGRHLLEMGRPSAEAAQRLDLGDVVRRTLAMLTTSGKIKGVAVDTDCAPGLVVLARRTQLEQVFVNLFINAADAMAGLPARRLSISAAARDGRIHCAVTDSGTGMPAHVVARIFEPFFTTKPPGKGTGLGLPVVRQIIEAHGGALDVESREGEGTTFRFSLPSP